MHMWSISFKKTIWRIMGQVTTLLFILVGTPVVTISCGDFLLWGVPIVLWGVCVVGWSHREELMLWVAYVVGRLLPCLAIKWKIKKYHTVGTIPNSNIKIVEKGKIDTKDSQYNGHQNKDIRVITKLPNSQQSYKGKVKTHKYINRQNQSTAGKPTLSEQFQIQISKSSKKAKSIPLANKYIATHFPDLTQGL
jgi:hypothetical protein